MIGNYRHTLRDSYPTCQKRKIYDKYVLLTARILTTMILTSMILTSIILTTTILTLTNFEYET